MAESNQLKGYQGIFFKGEVKQKLIEMQKKGLESTVEDMHITFKYGDTEEYPKELIGKEFKIKVVGYASDGKNSGFSIELPEEIKKFYKGSSIPHITVSIGEADGVKGKAVDTAKLDFKPLEETFEVSGQLGYFIYGKGKCMDNQVIDEHKKNNLSKGIKVLLIPKYMSNDELSEANISPTATVEAEYGENVIKGTQVTLAHHTKEYENNPAPCNTSNVPILPDNSTIIISHLDLDTLGGIAALLGRKKEDKEFWKAGEFVDLNGPHNLFQVDEATREKYVAYQAYQESHRMPRFTEITDVTNIVLEHIDIIDKIIEGDKTLIQDGAKWDKEVKKKIEDCLVFENDTVRVFNSSEGIFCSASYYSEKKGRVIPCTITRNGILKTVTIAMADGGVKFSAREIVQEMWGNEAGGHPGIAGSPRGKEMTEKDMQLLAILVNKKYNEINKRNKSIHFKSGEISFDD